MTVVWTAPEKGSFIVGYFRDPRERKWGVLLSLDPAGIWFRGLDLDSFQDWARQLVSENETELGLSTIFIPLGRVERLILDEPSGAVPAMAQIFKRITGRPVEAFLDFLHGDSREDGGTDEWT